MKLRQKKFHRMLIQVLEIPPGCPQFFGAGTLTGQLIDVVETASRKIYCLAIEQTYAWDTVKTARRQRMRARKILRAQIRNIRNVALALGFNDFEKPVDHSDRRLIQTGLIYAAQAEGLKSQFIDDAFMPLDFIERLETLASDLEKSALDEVSGLSASVAARAGIDHAQSEAAAALQRLDAIIGNTMIDEPAIVEQWRRSRRLEWNRPQKIAVAV